MYKKPIEYEPTFSRECLLLTLEVWNTAETFVFPKVIGMPLPVYQFFEYEKGIAKTYLDMKTVEKFYLNTLKKTLKDRKYFQKIVSTFWKNLRLVKPYFLGKKTIKNRKELQEFFKNACNVWAQFNLCYWFTYFENPKMPKEVFDESVKVRTEAENIIELLNHSFEAGLKNIFRKKYNPIMNFISIQELRKDKIPTKNMLEQKAKYCIYNDEKVYTNISIENFLKKENKKIISLEISEDIKEIKGQIAFEGIAKGKARLCFKPEDSISFEENEILISPMTTPHLLPAIKKASAIITDEGGITCHAAIVARELKKPCIIGTKIATKVFKTGDFVEVDANKGIVRKLVKE